MENGGNVNSKNEYQETPLFFAAQNGNISLVKILVEHSANVEIRTKWNIETTPLHVASKQGHIEVVKYLVGKCPQCVKSKNTFGFTAASVASTFKKHEVVEFLNEYSKLAK